VDIFTKHEKESYSFIRRAIGGLTISLVNYSKYFFRRALPNRVPLQARPFNKAAVINYAVVRTEPDGVDLQRIKRLEFYRVDK
jgi:hypothetical protein